MKRLIRLTILLAIASVTCGQGSSIPVDRTKHIKKFGGEIWYVSKSGNDSYDGKTSDTAKLTIKAAVLASSAGDGINIKAGVYDEIDLVIANDATELWGEIGTQINNSDSGGGTCIQVTGDTCRLSGLVTLQAGQIGFDIDGDGTFLEDCVAAGNSIAYDIDGEFCTLVRCRDQDATTTGFDIATKGNLLYLCATIATGGNSRGFYLSNSAASENMLYQCSSIGNGTAGYEIVSGCTYNLLAYCTSGGGDGRWVDADHTTVFSNFSFDDVINNEVTFAGGDTEYNIFKVTGAVRITNLYGTVTTIIASTASDIHLSLWSDTGGEVEITNNVGAPDLNAAVVDSLVIRNGVSTNALTIASALTPQVVEFGARSTHIGFDVIADANITTYIRLNITAALASGAIDWHCHWEPLSDNGFLEMP